ncbi:MAG TPA: DivIVA domain-containing protein, partial [Acidimicrobiales bacterium]|nr:DivIVA domain-containing protein [Acidimicrobiales bacterium]
MSDQPLTRIAASLGPDEVAGRSFPVTRRGFDQDAVRRFLEEAAGAIRDLRAREADIGARLVEAERRAASPVLDEETLTAAVGAETAKVLRTAHEAARDVIARAEARAAELVTEAGGVLAERTREAEAEARALSARARAEAAALLESTTAECRAMVDEAREARRRILADLAERRRGLHLQLEQLRAGKDALVEVVDATARSVDDVRARLADAEAYARVAADRVGDGAYGHDDVTLDGLLEEARSLPTVEDGEAAAIDVEVADAVPADAPPAGAPTA